jgi:hypothetical protein
VTPGDGQQPAGSADKSVGEIVSEVTEKASQLVREEIELAKAEVTQKVSSLAKGIGVGLAAGTFLGFAFSIFFHGLAWFFADLLDAQPWIGFLISFGILVLLAALAGFLAYRWIKGGAPPTPDLAIEEAKRTRDEFEHMSVERDQVGRSLEQGDRIGA